MSGDTEDLEDIIVFVPSVSEQRYAFAIDLVKTYQAKKVVDMGCGPCQLFRRLKWLCHLEHLVGVDVDEEQLKKSSPVAKPLMSDHLNPRDKPFKASLMHGSISSFDDRLHGYDIVICIEVIEHLYEPDLVKVPDVVFGQMKPKMALFTTPNADFNVIFGRMETEFRHWDHKFEWSRTEFQDWCNLICENYEYEVELVGMGQGPEGSEHLGCCTQGAVFTWCGSSVDGRHDSAEVIKQPYKLIAECDFPVCQELDIPLNTQIEWEIRRCMDGLIKTSSDDLEDYDEHGDLVYKIPLDRLMTKYSGINKICCGDESILRNAVQSCSSWSLSEDLKTLLYKEDDRESDGMSSGSEGEDVAYQQLLPDNYQEECWDDP